MGGCGLRRISGPQGIDVESPGMSTDLSLQASDDGPDVDLGAEPTSVAAADGRRAPTVCLNMIAKNEAPVIARCLASARPFIDHWIIVDTGSTDGTQQRVRECLQGIPGELHERPWRDFSHNRNQALELAGGAADYLLFIDADELLA